MPIKVYSFFCRSHYIWYKKKDTFNRKHHFEQDDFLRILDLIIIFIAKKSRGRQHIVPLQTPRYFLGAPNKEELSIDASLYAKVDFRYLTSQRCHLITIRAISILNKISSNLKGDIKTCLRSIFIGHLMVAIPRVTVTTAVFSSIWL